MTTQKPETAIPLILSSQSKGERSGKSSYLDELNMSAPVNIDRKYLGSYESGIAVAGGGGLKLWVVETFSLPVRKKTECR